MLCIHRQQPCSRHPLYKYSVQQTLVFPDKQAQNRFRAEGFKAGCKENKEIYSTDVDPTWSNVSSIKYAKHAGAKSWRYIFFYEKDGMNMCTFLF